MFIPSGWGAAAWMAECEHRLRELIRSPKRMWRGNPPPNLPPLGGGAGLPPPAGEGWGRGSHLRCNVLPLERGYGATGFPHPPTRWEGLGGLRPPKKYVHPVGVRRSRMDNR